MQKSNPTMPIWPGQYIVLEGIDGCGKDEQLRRVEAELSGGDRKVIVVREPGSTPYAEEMRDWLLATPPREQIDPVAQVMGFNFARRLLLTNVVGPALADNAIVLAARCSASTIAYQGYGAAATSGMTLPFIQQMCEGVVGQYVPTCLIILDLPVELAQQRKQLRTESNHYDTAAIEYHENIRRGYLMVARRWKSRGINVHVVDARGTPEEVFTSVMPHIRAIC